MRKTTKVTGTKIAQAAKDLNVTSVTIRRYISEFNIETATDENGIKVLPPKAMDELQVIRKLKEDGLTNPKVLEELEKTRSKGGGKSKAAVVEEEEEKEPAKAIRKATRIESKPTTKKGGRGRAVVEEVEEEEEEDEVEEAPAAKRGAKRRTKAEPAEKEAEAEEEESSEDETSESGESDAGDGRPKHSLTCQTCGKTFEHMNPRLRDCLDCYRAKRKERRRGGDRHKNVIQHPLAQQVVSKMASQKDGREGAEPAAERPERTERPERSERQNYAPTRTAAPTRQERPAQLQAHSASSAAQPVIGGLKTKVRSYRKAIEETRNITGSLKRRLERPDLPEGDRRWLEQIYAYQLILHQGWRHLSEYKSATPKSGDDK